MAAIRSPAMDEIRRLRDPFGREVVFDHRSWLHLAEGQRPELLDHLDAIIATVAMPLFHDDDPRAGRERFYARHLLLPRPWMRVIVDFTNRPGRVVTVLLQERDPRRPIR